MVHHCISSQHVLVRTIGAVTPPAHLDVDQSWANGRSFPLTQSLIVVVVVVVVVFVVVVVVFVVVVAVVVPVC